jgi:hypothetical protein
MCLILKAKMIECYADTSRIKQNNRIHNQWLIAAIPDSQIAFKSPPTKTAVSSPADSARSATRLHGAGIGR